MREFDYFLTACEKCNKKYVPMKEGYRDLWQDMTVVEKAMLDFFHAGGKLRSLLKSGEMQNVAESYGIDVEEFSVIIRKLANLTSKM